MTPSPTSGSSAAPLPPLPDLSGGPGGDSPQASGFAAALMGAIGPVKDSVTAINMACQKIVQSGSVPGSEQICAQIVGLANQLLPMAVQQMSQGGMMGQGQGPGAPIPPPPGAGPAPMPGMGQ